MDYFGKLRELPFVFTHAQAMDAEVTDWQLYRWRDTGAVLELSRGVFRRSDAPATAHLDVLAAFLRAPRAVVCLLSALEIHELTDEVTSVVQLAIPRDSASPHITYPPVQVVRFARDTFELGVEHIEVAPGEKVRVYDAARSIVDVMRFRRRLGEPIVYAALHAYLERRGSRPAKLGYYAQALNVAGPVHRALEVALSK